MLLTVFATMVGCPLHPTVTHVDSNFAWPDGSKVVESYQHGMKIGDRCFRYAVTDNLVANTPEWSPEDGTPPLSIKAAVSVSKRVAAMVFGSSDIIVQTFELRRNSATERWFYIIGWGP